MTTKIHLPANELDLPVDFLLTSWQISDYTPEVELLGEHKAEAVIANKGYDSSPCKRGDSRSSEIFEGI